MQGTSGTIAATAFGYFGSMVESYDSLIRRCVPRYAEMTDRLIDYMPTKADRVLELGCGTGNRSLRLAAKYPDAAITFVDAAPEMIDLTRARLREVHPRAADRATFLAARFEEIASHRPRDGFDVISSCISLHHVRDKRILYRELYSMLRPGGTFRFADQLRGATEELHDRNWQRWLEFCRADGNCTVDEVGSLLDHAAAHDHYTPLREHFALLEAAGFSGCDCVWRNLIWGIVTANRTD